MTTEDNKPDGGADGNAPIPGGDSEQPSKVDYQTYRRAMDDLQRWKREANDALGKLASVSAEKEKAEREELAKQGEWQKLAESAQSKAKEWEEKYSTLNQTIVESRKAHAIASKLAGNLRPDFFHLLDTDKVAYNPDTGEVEETSAVKAADEFAKRYPELILPKTTAAIPNDASKGSPKGLTHEEWSKLPYKEKKARFNEVKFT
jgi:hypothetical protein